jgi:hypothetical protein
MGWYGNYVLPVGALLVGAVASTGFGLASWGTGTKITGNVLVAVGLTLVAGYWAAQYIEFRVAFPHGAELADGSRAGFLDWYDVVTRSFAWKDHGGKLGSELGAWGYALRAGELVGFSGGGLLVPVLLRKMPYCAACGVYMRQPLVAVIPAGVPARKIAKKDAVALAARDTEAREAFTRAGERLDRLLAAGRTGDAAVFAAAVAESGPLAGRRAAEKLPARIHLRVVHCRQCAAGELRAALATGRGKQLRIEPLRAEALDPGIAPRLLARG